MAIAGDVAAESDVAHQPIRAVDGEVGRPPVGDLIDERFDGVGGIWSGMGESGVGYGDSGFAEEEVQG